MDRNDEQAAKRIQRFFRRYLARKKWQNLVDKAVSSGGLAVDWEEHLKAVAATSLDGADIEEDIALLEEVLKRPFVPVRQKTKELSLSRLVLEPVFPPGTYLLILSLDNLSSGTTVLAQYAEDGLWYKAEILSVEDSGFDFRTLVR